MVADPSAISRQSVEEQSATDWRSVGDQSVTKSCVGIACNRCNWLAIGPQLVGYQSATCRWPPNLSTIDLVAERFHLQQLKPPCDQFVPATFCKQSATSPTSLQPLCNLPATTWNFGRKEVADRLQSMCDRGFISNMGIPIPGKHTLYIGTGLRFWPHMASLAYIELPRGVS